jgi:hypothetical protein
VPPLLCRHRRGRNAEGHTRPAHTPRPPDPVDA